VDSSAFTNLIIAALIRGFRVDAALLWNTLLDHPWMIVAAAGLLVLSLLSRLSRRRTKRRYR
jgi:hypothetical protein